MILILTLFCYIINSFVNLYTPNTEHIFSFIFIPLLVTTYPLFKKNKDFFIYSCILSLLASSCFLRSFILNIVLFCLFCFTIVNVYKQAKYNFINLFLLCIFFMIIYIVIVYLSFNTNFNLLILFNKIFSSFIINIVYVLILFLVIKTKVMHKIT